MVLNLRTAEDMITSRLAAIVDDVKKILTPEVEKLPKSIPENRASGIVALLDKPAGELQPMVRPAAIMRGRNFAVNPSKFHILNKNLEVSPDE
ncbi:hypothetical protein PVK06_037168 [Gossypium arboreum]|uniref:Uncharacterized protein n=1 Tax=Gossypium arboreum TaxID=29729 RepID=A0ABR0MWI0_GOSAR|nr:hypothetical protein PVK06_037168 [Gossypium arboreum]